MKTTRRMLLSFILSLLLTSCAEETSVINPQGSGARAIAELWWVLFIIATIIYVLVMGLLLVGLFRPRHETTVDLIGDDHPRGSHTFIVLSGIVLPVIILTGVFIYSLDVMEELSPDDEEGAITIEIVGHQFWWEVAYADYDFVTANEILIPVDTPVRFEVTSDDVIHSFWVPALNGKMDLVPDRTNVIWLEAEEVGVYQGKCAELCGLQHAKMQFQVIAVEREEFESWVENQQLPAPLPENDLTLRGQQIFMGSACVYCHTIRGTTATSDLGPDLTHLASRRMIGAGILPNTTGHLAGWIIDSQSIKPGNQMPPMYMNAEDLQALLAYLDTLE